MKQLRLIVLFSILSISFFSQAQSLILQKEGAHEEGVNSISLSNDGSTLLSGGNDTKTYVWNIKTFEKLKGALKNSDKVSSVAISENNKFYISGSSDFKIRVYDLELNIPTKVLNEHTAEITKLAINPISYHFASGSKDNIIKIWDNSKSKNSLFTLIGHQKEITGLFFSPDGKVLISSSLDNTVKIWDASNGELTKSIDLNVKGITALTCSSDGQSIFVAGNNGAVIVLDGVNYLKKTSLDGFKQSINTISISGDGQYLAVGGKDKKVVVFEIASSKMVKSFIAHDNDITGLAFNSQGDVLISASLDGSIKTWNVKELNIGKKMFVKTGNQHSLSISNSTIIDDNHNGILEPNEKSFIQFEIQNNGTNPAINILSKVSLGIPNSSIKFSNELSIGNIDIGKKQVIKIPLILSSDLQSSTNSFTVSIIDATKENVESFKLNFQTSGNKGYGYIKIIDYSYSSATGKAEIGAPVSAKLKIKNISKGTAKNVKVNFILPDKVLAVNKLAETIDVLAPEEEKEIHLEFYADKNFTNTEINIGIEIQGAFSNAKETSLKIKMNEVLANTHNTAIAKRTETQSTSTETDDVDVDLPTSAKVGNYYALIIGVSAYIDNSINTLDKPILDAIALKEVLVNKYSFKPENVKTLKNPTRKDIFKEFSALQKISKEDNLLVFYAGHGHYNAKEQQGYWLPSDAEKSDPANWISNSDIKDRLRGIDCKHTLLISDACFSGGLFKTRKAFEDANHAINEVYKLPSRKAMTSGTLTEVPDKSVFIEYLIKRLQNNSDKYLTSQKLFSSMQEAIINNSSVIPQWGTITDTGDEGGDFIFIKK